MTVRILTGDCMDVLPTLEPESVHCCVTSPPYWALRDYGIPPTHWPAVSYSPMPGLPEVTVPAQTCCLGLEADPVAYVGHLVLVWREVWRVLRDDATCWLNIGDCYANDGKWGGATGGKHAAGLHGNTGIGRRKVRTGLKPKDLVGIPWRLAYALQADGWYLRSRVTWCKTNPMPESVTDRPANATEDVFLLTKSPRYFYDAEAVRQPAVTGDLRQPQGSEGCMRPQGGRRHLPGAEQDGQGRGFRMPEKWNNPNGRNLWSWWALPTKPFPSAHFATYPPDLVEPCVKAGTSERGCCPGCGAPWERIVEVSHGNPGNRSTNGPRSLERRHETAGFSVRLEKRTATIGWCPTCKCDASDPIPCTVLDPFGGAMTTGLVADRLGRDATLIELNPDYAEMGSNRIHDDAPLFAPVESTAVTP